MKGTRVAKAALVAFYTAGFVCLGMALNVMVRSRTEAGALLMARSQVDAIAAVVTPRTSPRASTGRVESMATCNGFADFPGPKLTLQFDDIRESEAATGAPPSEDDVRQFLYWAKGLPDASTLLIHCTEGIGRSAALAIAYHSMALGPGSDEEVLTKVLADRPLAWPNLWVIKHADRLLGRNGAMYQFWVDWKDSHGQGIYTGARR